MIIVFNRLIDGIMGITLIFPLGIWDRIIPFKGSALIKKKFF